MVTRHLMNVQRDNFDIKGLSPSYEAQGRNEISNDTHGFMF